MTTEMAQALAVIERLEARVVVLEGICSDLHRGLSQLAEGLPAALDATYARRSDAMSRASGAEFGARVVAITTAPATRVLP